MTPRDVALIVSALVNVGLMAWLIVLVERLEAEREKCRRECVLIQTVLAQKRALDAAWVELDKMLRKR